MGYTVNFTDNQLVTSDDLLGISKSIDKDSQNVNFKNNTLYGVDELNKISASLITKGVSNGLNVSTNGENVNISQGTAYFDDGKKIIVDADGITLTRAENAHQYVWLSNDTVAGLVSAKCTENIPSGDYVMLAEIAIDGTVTLKKDIALMKNSSLLPNCYERFTEYLVIEKSDEGTTLSLDLGKNFRRMIILGQEQPIYINWDTNKMYQYGKPYMLESGVLNTKITIKSYLQIEFISYENNILTYKAHCSTIHGTIFGDLVIDCM